MIKLAQATVLAVLAVVLTGCGAVRSINSIGKAPDPNIELLESELRWMEDNIYQLDSQLDRALERLQVARRENAGLRLELEQALNEKSDTPTETLPPKKSRTTSGRNTSVRSDNDSNDGGFDVPSEDELLNLEAPTIELVPQGEDDGPGEATDAPADAESPLEPSMAPPQLQSEPLPPATHDTAPSDDATDPFDQEADRRAVPRTRPRTVRNATTIVSKIRLNPRLTGGYNYDDQPGHDGVMVVIEPLDADGHYAEVPGDVTVEIRDPQRQGLAGRVGKWHFAADESAEYLHRSLLGKGVHLELPWTSVQPVSKKLDVRVVYRTPQGKSLQAKRTISITPTAAALESELARRAGRGSEPARTATRSRWRPYR